MYDWFTAHKLPLGLWLKGLVDLLNEHAQGVFDLISLGLGAVIGALTSGLLLFSPFLLIPLLAAGAYLLHRSVGLALFIVLALLLVVNLGSQ